MKLYTALKLILIISSSQGFADHSKSKNLNTRDQNKQKQQISDLDEIDLVDLLDKKPTTRKEFKTNFKTQFKLNNCYLGSSVFNAFAVVNIDLENKSMTYKDADKDEIEKIELPELTCVQTSEVSYFCQSQPTNIAFRFHELNHKITETDSSIRAKIRSLANYAPTSVKLIIGELDRPYYNIYSKKWAIRNDTIRCIQQIYQ